MPGRMTQNQGISQRKSGFPRRRRNAKEVGLKEYGRVAEWLKALAWKAGMRVKLHREFESHPFRQPNCH